MVLTPNGRYRNTFDCNHAHLFMLRITIAAMVVIYTVTYLAQTLRAQPLTKRIATRTAGNKPRAVWSKIGDGGEGPITRLFLTPYHDHNPLQVSILRGGPATLQDAAALKRRSQDYVMSDFRSEERTCSCIVNGKEINRMYWSSPTWQWKTH